MSEGGFFLFLVHWNRFNHNFLILSLVFRYDIHCYVGLKLQMQWELTAYVDNHSAEIRPSVMRWICSDITNVRVRKSWLRDNTIVLPFKKTKVNIEWLSKVFSVRNQLVPWVAVTGSNFLCKSISEYTLFCCFVAQISSSWKGFYFIL